MSGLNAGSQTYSGLAGLADINNPINVTGSISARTVTFGASFSSSFSIPMPRNNLLPVLRINVSGLGSASNYWYKVHPACAIPYSGGVIFITSLGSNTGRTVKVILTNNNGGSGPSINFPDMTVTINGRLYTYPWS